MLPFKTAGFQQSGFATRFVILPIFAALFTKNGAFFTKTGHFQVTLWGFGDNGQFDSFFDGSPDMVVCFNASHHGKRVYDPKSLQNVMLKYKG
ncbi:MAG: hypothetical protein EXS05_14540 [Planctomycetaceae bacterium]|nr:hypothetical protein [Planctomycetaceae bacterium]